MDKRFLLERLDAIAASLRDTGKGLALLALGSSGVETRRMDAFSDLDFFAVVKDGAKPVLIADLGWLERVAPIGYAYRNTADGHKVLFADGVFCELAVFEANELSGIPFAPVRLVWRAPGFDESICTPVRAPDPSEPDAAWLLGEALTGMYVGLSRMRRGERLAAVRAIQVGAVEAVLKLAQTVEPARGPGRDPFAWERRFEVRRPDLTGVLPSFMQGYERSGASALAMLGFLERHWNVNPAMAAAIRALALEPEPAP